jgi:hypothetical protein
MMKPENENRSIILSKIAGAFGERPFLKEKSREPRVCQRVSSIK